MNDLWAVYILKCADKSLYTGISNNIPIRFQRHCAGKGAKYTRSRLPLEMLWHSKYIYKYGEALQVERRIKHMTRAQKLAWVKAVSYSGPY